MTVRRRRACSAETLAPCGLRHPTGPNGGTSVLPIETDDTDHSGLAYQAPFISQGSQECSETRGGEIIPLRLPRGFRPWCMKLDLATERSVLPMKIRLIVVDLLISRCRPRTTRSPRIRHGLPNGNRTSSNIGLVSVVPGLRTAASSCLSHWLLATRRTPHARSCRSPVRRHERPGRSPSRSRPVAAPNRRRTAPPAPARVRSVPRRSLRGS
jgi:hypothetical protein